MIQADVVHLLRDRSGGPTDRARRIVNEFAGTVAAAVEARGTPDAAVPFDDELTAALVVVAACDALIAIADRGRPAGYVDT